MILPIVGVCREDNRPTGKDHRRHTAARVVVHSSRFQSVVTLSGIQRGCILTLVLRLDSRRGFHVVLAVLNLHSEPNVLTCTFCGCDLAGLDDVPYGASPSVTIHSSGPGQFEPLSSPAPETEYRRCKNHFHVLTDCVEPDFELTPTSTFPIEVDPNPSSYCRHRAQSATCTRICQMVLFHLRQTDLPKVEKIPIR
ncbi:unnamed protein product [Dibothriocephalus latus]|uniref:Uncharacterized protein n=1 Tax=Dibothriocephalus latus TaxID=60516 RepID=A0A3P7Q972_DIBLA|nr:unnamed protein product [Dibothriocephalus latus]